MKRWVILLVASLSLFCLLLATPYLIERRALQDRLVRYVEQGLGISVALDKVGWRWFPVPAITLSHVKAESASFTLGVPQAYLIIDPVFFLSGKVSLLHAQLLAPELVVKEGGQPPGTIGLAGGLAVGRLRIEGGKVSLPRRYLAPGVEMPPLSLTGLNGTVSCRAGTLELALRANSEFARDLGLDGRLDLPAMTYHLHVSAVALDSARLITVSSHAGPAVPPSLPMVSDLSFQARLEGRGADRFKLEIGGRAPFTLHWQGQAVRVATADGLTVQRQADDFSLDIKEVALAEPRLRLTGRLARQWKGDGAAARPEWFIDLSGADIDLDAVRAATLALFGQHPIATKVCDIVRGGSAPTARFAFAGPAADFSHLARMQIWAEVKDAPINIPTPGLFLDQASGSIAILDGQLTGKNLSATLDRSHGTNGEILLDLAREQHGFRLDLDLDADLQDLRAVLARVVPWPRFQEELGRFVAIEGQAQGHLRLGDDLRQIKTEVAVNAMRATGRYDRLPWPFSIDGGRLRLTPQHLNWAEVSGTLGAQKINKTTGGLSWQDTLLASLEALDADLDLKGLFEEGSLRRHDATLAFRDLMRGRISELSGQATLAESHFAGPLRAPEQWQYHTSVNCRNLKVAGEGLPELSSEGVRAFISQQQADFAGDFALFGQEVRLSGKLRHSLFDQWHGELEINGDIGQALGDWLLARRLLPVTTLPKLPFRLEKFMLSSQEPGFGGSQAQGTVIPLSPNTQARMAVDISQQANQSRSTLTFLDGDRHGSLTYQVWSGQGKGALLTWQGDLTVDTLDALFPQQVLLSGALHGAGRCQSEQGAAAYSGSLSVKGVRFRPESLTPDLAIDLLDLRGNGNTITIEQSDLALAGVPAKVAGQVVETAGYHSLDLQVSAPKVARDSLLKVFDFYRQRAAEGDGRSVLDAIRGVIRFDLAAFEYAHHRQGKEATAGEGDSHTYVATPFKGAMTLGPAGIDLQIDEGTVCGIRGQGLWSFRDDGADVSVSFSSGLTPLTFEQALPCLGIKQSLIIGPFTLEGQVSGRPKQWRQGAVTLSSTEGLIKRMNLLSEIFTAVNVTDYFTWHDLPDMNDEGLRYHDLLFKGHVDSNNLVLDKVSIKGKGVNLSGRGTIDLTDLDADLTFFIAPFKTLDWMVTSLPMIGKALGGAKESLLTFPVAVSGNLRAPEVTPLAPTAIGSAILEMLMDTMTLPLRILQPQDGPPLEQDAVPPAIPSGDEAPP